MPDIHDYQRGDVFIIGIGGSSTSGLALLLKQLGYSVSGSNLNIFKKVWTIKPNQQLQNKTPLY